MNKQACEECSIVGISKGGKLVKDWAVIPCQKHAAVDNLLAALKRATDHLIMSGAKQNDAPEALTQAREAIADAESH